MRDVPFINNNHYRPESIKNDPADIDVLVRYSLFTVHHHQRYLAGLKFVKGLRHAELLNDGVLFLDSTYTGGIHHDQGFVFGFDDHGDSVMGGAGHIVHNLAFLTQ